MPVIERLPIPEPSNLDRTMSTARSKNGDIVLVLVRGSYSLDGKTWCSDTRAGEGSTISLRPRRSDPDARTLR